MGHQTGQPAQRIALIDGNRRRRTYQDIKRQRSNDLPVPISILEPSLVLFYRLWSRIERISYQGFFRIVFLSQVFNVFDHVRQISHLRPEIESSLPLFQGGASIFFLKLSFACSASLKFKLDR